MGGDQMKFLLGVLLLAATSLIGYSQASRATPLTYVPGWRLPIEFLNAAYCNGHWQNNNFCDGPGEITYYNWTPKKKAFVLKEFRLIAKAQHIAPLQNMLLTKKQHVIRLVLVDSSSELGASAQYHGYVIYLAKDYFTEGPLRFHSTTVGVHALIHELYHQYAYARNYDDKSRPFWTSLAKALNWGFGWDSASGYPADPPSPITVKEYYSLFNQYNQLYGLSPERAFAFDLKWSIAHHFPSIYSMTDIDEYFAELGSFLCTEPSLQKRLPAKVNAWIAREGLL